MENQESQPIEVQKPLIQPKQLESQPLSQTQLFHESLQTLMQMPIVYEFNSGDQITAFTEIAKIQKNTGLDPLQTMILATSEATGKSFANAKEISDENIIRELHKLAKTAKAVQIRSTPEQIGEEAKIDISKISLKLSRRQDLVTTLTKGYADIGEVGIAEAVINSGDVYDQFGKDLIIMSLIKEYIKIGDSSKAEELFSRLTHQSDPSETAWLNETYNLFNYNPRSFIELALAANESGQSLEWLENRFLSIAEIPLIREQLVSQVLSLSLAAQLRHFSGNNADELLRMIERRLQKEGIPKYKYEIPPVERAYSLLAKTYASIGDFDKALITAEQYPIEETFADIAILLAKAGRIEEAEQLREKAGANDYLVDKEVVNSLLKADREKEAEELADRIRSKYSRADALTAIHSYKAVQMARASGPQSALEYIRGSIKDNPFPEVQIADQAVAIAKVAATA